MSTETTLNPRNDAKRGRLVNPNSLSLILTVSALAVVVNVIGGTVVGLLAIPFLFLDAIGTFFVAALFGIRWGIVVGVITNLILGITTGPTVIPFALVQILLAIIVGGVANAWGYNRWSAGIAGLLAAVFGPALGASIAVAVFGGLTGRGIDVFVLWLSNSGQNIFSSAYLPRLGANLIDKILTAYIVLAILQLIPTSLVKRRRREPLTQERQESEPTAA